MVESKKTIPVGPLSRGIASGKVQPAKHSVLIGDYGAVMQTCARNYRQARSEGSLEKMQTELNNLMLYQRVRDDEELEMLILGEKPHESRLEKLVRPGSRVRTIEKAADAIFILSGLGTAIDYFANNGQHALYFLVPFLISGAYMEGSRMAKEKNKVYVAWNKESPKKG